MNVRSRGIRRPSEDSLFRTVRAVLCDLRPVNWKVGYHSNPQSKRAFFGDVHDGFRVSFKRQDYFVLLNYTRDMKRFEVLVGHSRGRLASGNTPDITFTENHFTAHGLLVISPSLVRCNGALVIEPKNIADFPARVLGRANRFVMGFVDANLFPRLFVLCLAKKCSIEQV
jgi:hypothetical protein